MEYTSGSLRLAKPQLSDVPDITRMNPNWDKIDENISGFNDKINLLSDDGKISKKGQIYNGYKGRYFSDIFPSGTSLDDIRTNVFCYMQGSDNVPNLPNGLTSANSCLEVQTCYSSDGTPYTTKQTFTRINGTTWQRFYSGADKTWYDWQQIATTDKTEILLLNQWQKGIGDMNQYVSKCGNIVAINVSIKGGVSNENTPIFTLPPDYSPSSNIVIGGAKNWSKIEPPRFITVKTNGDVVVRSGFNSSDTYILDFSYSLK